MNSFGRHVRFHIFGESHGSGVGVVIDGVPAGLPIDEAAIQADLDRRRPGQSRFTTSRKEPDRFEILSGVLRGRATGAPLTLRIANKDARSRAYGDVRVLPRPGHSDWTAHVRYGGWNDFRGGGHFSGRLTAAMVGCGAIAKAILSAHGVTVGAHLLSVADLGGVPNTVDVAGMTDTESNPFKTAMPEFVERWTELLDAARSARDSLGGVVEFRAEGLPVGVGEPWALPVESHLAQLFFAIPAVKGVSFGCGFDSTTMLGSEHNDPYDPDGDGGMHPRTNHAGGILGGLTTGAPVWGRIAIKPTSSIFQPQDTVDLATGEARALELKGRHDPLIAIRAVPVVEAAAAIGLVDLFAQFKAARALGEPFPPRVVRADGDEALPS